ncbi:MAG: protein arginine kinase [Planctomycetota bacterium]
MRLNPDGPWTDANAPHGDVVLSSRVRLARNIAGFPFVSRTSTAQCHEILNLARQIVVNANLSDDLIWIDLEQTTEQERQLLVERHLISKNLAENVENRAAAILDHERLSIMVNEEDHLRMQALGPGLQIEPVFDRINQIDDLIESHIDYAFSSRWGYLTACPTNVGTGIRLSVMMHLPALKITGEIERVRRAAKELHLAVRGYYGEGSESAGDFYQISNQVTLGRTEADLRQHFRDAIIPQIIEYERQSRQMLCRRNGVLLDDRAHRALGILRSARLLGVEEAMKLLSRVRLGVCLERLDGIDQGVVNQLFLQVQPAHLRLLTDTELADDELREARANLVRHALGEH